MGVSRHFFECRDIDIRVKYQVYTASPLNALLWGCEVWNISKKNIKKLQSCHHTFIRRILKIKWNQVKEQ